MRSSVKKYAVAATLAVVVLGLTGCESEEEREAEKELGSAADLTTCLADATAAPTPYPEGFPADWPFPPDTTVFATEDRGGDGIVVSAVTGSPLDEVLDFLNGDVVDAGYQVTSGETEEHDAEANWSGSGHHGRWAIRESAACPGEVTLQVLSTNE